MEYLQSIINPLTSPGEVVTVFTYPYLSAGAPALGKVKGLMIYFLFLVIFLIFKKFKKIMKYR